MSADDTRDHKAPKNILMYQTYNLTLHCTRDLFILPTHKTMFATNPRVKKDSSSSLQKKMQTR